MSSLRELRNRIKGVQSTQKITNAMRMVAAAKLKKSQHLIKSLHHFSDGFNAITNKLFSQYEGEGIDSPLLSNPKHDKHLLIVMTSDRGLCGGFNSGVFKVAQKFLSHHAKKRTEVLAIGKKGKDYFSKDRKLKLVNLKSATTFSKLPSLADIKAIVDELISLVATENLHEITIASGKFQSALTQIPHLSKVFPYSCEKIKAEDNSFIGEPSIDKLLPDMIYHDFLMKLLVIFVEHTASEHAARMTAMENASRNARDMIHDLKLMLNRSRQAKITTELMEIVSGAEALVGNFN